MCSDDCELDTYHRKAVIEILDLQLIRIRCTFDEVRSNDSGYHTALQKRNLYILSSRITSQKYIKGYISSTIDGKERTMKILLHTYILLLLLIFYDIEYIQYRHACS